MARHDQWVAPSGKVSSVRRTLVGNRRIPDLARRAGPGRVVKPVHPMLRTATAPFAKCIALRTNRDPDRLVLAPRCRRQHNTRPPRHGLTRLVGAGQGFQFGTFGRTQDNYSRYPTHDPLQNSHLNRSHFQIRKLGRDVV